MLSKVTEIKLFILHDDFIIICCVCSNVSRSMAYTKLCN